MLLLALVAAAAASLQPSEVRTFQDWTVACDNGLDCEAIALLPAEAEWTEWVSLSFRRGARAGDGPLVMLQGFEDQPAALLADGHALAARFSSTVDGFAVQADQTALIAALRDGRELEVRRADGSRLGRVSLAGAAAAMLYMDERQRRVGTVTALVRPGTRPAATVPPPPPLPQVVPSRPPLDPEFEIGDERIAALRRELGCTIDEVGGPDQHEVDQIATNTALILLACGSGAYNLSSVPIIARFGDGAGEFETRVAEFDMQWGVAAEGRPTLINGAWDPETLRLSEFSKGRGLGDCGTRSEYAWDGTRFRLVHQEEMEECRGSLYYVTTWRAQVLP